MNDVIEQAKAENLPTLIDRAAAALLAARTSGEVLEARDLARVAYDAAKTAGRMARAKQAHDEVIAAVYRTQADALLIEARAKMRLADEYDAAQARGEVAGHGRSKVEADNVTTVADLGLRRDEIHEARKLRNAEAAEPGLTERALREIVARGEEPTKARLRREVLGDDATAEPAREMSDAEAKLRRELAKMTTDALIDEVVGLKAQLAEEKEKRRRAEAKRDELRDQITVLTADGDLGRKLGAALDAERRTRGRLREVQAQLARETRRSNGLEKRVQDLERRLAGQEIDL
jgi:uncharacterized protein YjiS (DUF1127 family)